MHVPNDGSAPDHESRDWWLGIGAALHHETDGGPEGSDLWHEWSALWSGYHEGATTLAWESLHRTQGLVRTGATIEALARQHGWRRVTADAFDDAPALIGEVEPIRERGKLVNNLTNAVIFLAHNLDSVLPNLHRDLMTAQDCWQGGPMTDSALALAKSALEQAGLKANGRADVADAVRLLAEKHQRHPIRHWLAGLAHDGQGRLDTWLIRYMGSDDTPHTRAVGRKFLIQMVARVMQPGCKADHTLVLSGGQGQKKSAACRILAEADYFNDTLPSITNDRTRAMFHLPGLWLVELSEMAPTRKSEAEDVKSFLSGAVDQFRRPYGRLTETHARQCVFVGTTNEEQFLRDSTGGRRFWPVKVRQVIDLDGLAAERDQLFAEAVAAYQAKEPWWLDRDFETEHARPVQEAAYISDEWTGDIAAWLDRPDGDADGFDPVEGQTPSARDGVTLSDVMALGLGIPPGQ